MKLKPIAEQVVVVMGASSGIGRLTAKRFAAKGAKVVVAARGEEGLQSLVEEIRRDGGEALYVVADTAIFDQVKAVADTAVTRYGRIDTWVHAAAVAVYARFDELTPAEFQQIIQTNLVGQAYGAMAALPYMKAQQGGALIHIGSVEGKHAIPLHSAYAASKHGLTGMLEALRVELAHDKMPISVTHIIAASINTPFYNKAKTELGVKPRPYPPVYDPGVVANAILFAAEHPRREIIAGGSGKAIIDLHRISPRLPDLLLGSTAFRFQRSNEPKAANAPNNLFGPVSGYDTVKGDFSREAKPISLYTWLAIHPAAKFLLLSALPWVGLAGMLVAGRITAREARRRVPRMVWRMVTKRFLPFV